MTGGVTNIVIVGLGGQGVLRAARVLAGAAFKAGKDVRSSTVRGMSQRGGFVSSDVRFGEKVASPMVPAGAADYVVALGRDQVVSARKLLAPDGVVVGIQSIDECALPSPKTLNVAALGVLSRMLDLPVSAWLSAIADCFPARLRDMNVEAFHLGREE